MVLLASSPDDLHDVFFREALAQLGAKHEGGAHPPPCAVKGRKMACAGEGKNLTWPRKAIDEYDPPKRIPLTTVLIFKMLTALDRLTEELIRLNFIDFGITDDVTGQVKDNKFCCLQVFR